MPPDLGTIGNVSRILPLAFLVVCQSGMAEDARLSQVRSSLIGMRSEPSNAAGPRGSGPQLTVVKHELRDWVESRLTTLTRQGDEVELQQKLNSELRDAKLLCGSDAPEQQPCYLNDLRFHRSGVFLILQTAVGIECGFDESAYLYSWSEEGWRRVWQSEQNKYTESAYKPQTIHAVRVSSYNRANEYLVLTLGSQSWCSSAWRTVYYRVFRLGPDPEATPLIDGEEGAYLGNDPPIQGSVSRDEVLVEFAIRSIDAGVHNRKAVRDFRINSGGVKRIDPLALSPRDFVDEWMTRDWREAALWSESAGRKSSRDWHTRLHKDFVSGEFLCPTMHCPTTPDLWQVGFGAADAGMTYFLVRWRPPFRFSIVQVADHTWSTCTEEDPQADDESRTLFPVQDQQ